MKSLARDSQKTQHFPFKALTHTASNICDFTLFSAVVFYFCLIFGGNVSADTVAYFSLLLGITGGLALICKYGFLIAGRRHTVAEQAS